MSDSPEQDGELDLGIGLDTVAGIIDAARAVEELEEDEANEDLQDEENPEDNDPEAMAAALEEQIDSLNEDEQAALIAIAWVGRGDHEPEDWTEALRLARERNENGSASTYLMGMDMMGDLLSEGLAAFGISAEEIERP